MGTNFEHVFKAKSPRIMMEAIKFFAVKEVAGPKHNPIIMEWADRLGLKKIYTSDEIPWCGLFMAIVVHNAGLERPFPASSSLAAVSWLKFGTPIHIGQACFADVLVFKRPGGHHVGLYVGEDKLYFYVLGGNQSDMVGFTRIEKARCIGVRRTKWKIAQPDNIKKVFLNGFVPISKNEA
jgi:uncharacterized protein (TIGR02594 family)